MGLSIYIYSIYYIQYIALDDLYDRDNPCKREYSCDCLETVGFIVKPREDGCIWLENPPSPEVLSHEAIEKVSKLRNAVQYNRKLGYYRISEPTLVMIYCNVTLPNT